MLDRNDVSVTFIEWTVYDSKSLRTILRSFISVIVGSIIYRFLLTFALQFGLSASDLNLFSAALVAIAISLPFLKKRRKPYARS